MGKKEIKFTRSELKTLSCIADEFEIDVSKIKELYLDAKDVGFVSAPALRELIIGGIPITDALTIILKCKPVELGQKASEFDISFNMLKSIFEELAGKVETKKPKLDIKLITEETAQEMNKILERALDEMGNKDIPKTLKDAPKYSFGFNVDEAEKMFSDSILDDLYSHNLNGKKLDDVLAKAIKDTDEEIAFQTLCQKERKKIDRLIKLGILGSDDVRSHNVGASDYSKHIIQPWAIWADYKLDPFDADIIKRVLRDKKGESKKLDYEKIIHICQEKLRQIG